MNANHIDRLLILFSWCCALVVGGSVTTLLFFLFWRGLPHFDLPLFFGDTAPLQALSLRQQVFDGLFPAIVGTLALVLLAICLALPVGIAAGIYMAEYASGRTKQLLSLMFDLLSAIPSIVIGLSGLAVAILLHRQFSGKLGPCLLLSALALALLILPYLIRSTQSALESIEPNIRKTALTLGATKLQNIFLVLLPHRLSDLTSGVILAIGRCAEDTAVIMLTGVVATAGVPHSLLRGYEALPFYIYTVSSQYSDAKELASGFSAAIILVILCCGLFLLSFFIQHSLKQWLLFRRGQQ